MQLEEESGSRGLVPDLPGAKLVAIERAYAWCTLPVHSEGLATSVTSAGY